MLNILVGLFDGSPNEIWHWSESAIAKLIIKKNIKFLRSIVSNKYKLRRFLLYAEELRERQTARCGERGELD